MLARDVYPHEPPQFAGAHEDMCFLQMEGASVQAAYRGEVRKYKSDKKHPLILQEAEIRISPCRVLGSVA